MLKKMWNSKAFEAYVDVTCEVAGMLKKMWNSKAFETITDVTFEVSCCLGEAIVEVFSKGSKSSNSSTTYSYSNSSTTYDYSNSNTSYDCSKLKTTYVDSKSNATYDYWKSLSYQEQEEYFKSNEYLKDYIKNDFYENDRELTAKHVQYIADRLNREFTNKYDRY